MKQRRRITPSSRLKEEALAPPPAPKAEILFKLFPDLLLRDIHETFVLKQLFFSEKYAYL